MWRGDFLWEIDWNFKGATFHVLGGGDTAKNGTFTGGPVPKSPLPLPQQTYFNVKGMSTSY